MTAGPARPRQDALPAQVVVRQGIAARSTLRLITADDVRRLGYFLEAAVSAADGMDMRDALSKEYAASEWLIPERDPDGSLSHDWLRGEFEALIETIRLTAKAIREAHDAS